LHLGHEHSGVARSDEAGSSAEQIRIGKPKNMSAIEMNVADRPRPSILVVDDDPLVSELVAKQCTVMGLSVRRATNGLRALVTARQHRPTLLITALRLPHLDGLSLCERLLGPEAPGMEAIVMSGSFDLEDYERCDSLGATPVEKGSGFWPQLREALVDSLPGDEHEAISRHESWDDLKQIPSTPRILIIDADPRPADLLTSRLKKFGIEVLTAMDGFRGFQVARNEMPSMIVAAHHLPDCDAEHLLWKLRSSPRTRQLPVFVMGETLSKGSQDNLRREVAGAAGAAGFFAKPLDAEMFYPTIERYCGLAVPSLTRLAA
jgi:CheY-like chemotaxis protein